MAFFVIGGIEVLIMRAQLIRAVLQLVSPAVYNLLFTMHGFTMTFLVSTTILAGFANYLVPLMIGARDMAMPKVNAMSYWIFFFGSLFLYSSVLIAQAPDAGWYDCANQTELPFTPRLDEDYWALAIIMLGTGTIASGLNLIVTIVKMRCPRITFGRMPLFCWSALVMSALIIGAFPPLTVAALETWLDSPIGTSFFLPAAGGDAILWEHHF